MPRIIVAGREGGGRAFALALPMPSGGWIVGSGPLASVRVPGDPWVRSVHARVVERDGRWLLRDESGGGTRVNWQPIGKDEESPLEPGDLVGVGSTLLVFVD